MPKPRATKPRREADVQTAILALLRAHSISAWKVGSGAFKVGDRYVKMGQRGMSDIIGIQPRYTPFGPSGRFLAIEVKRPGGKPTLEQAAFLATVRKAGGIAFVATSCDDVIRELGL